MPLASLAEALRPEAMRGLLTQLAEYGAGAWRDAARRGLRTSRVDYVNAVQAPTQDGEDVVVELRGKLANMLERGSGPYPLQVVMLKDGRRAVVIPFRFQTVGTRGTVAPAMGEAYGPDGALSRRAAHYTVSDPKALGHQVMKAMRRVGEGGRLPEGLFPKLRATHTTDLYAGMERRGDPGHRQYRTFRTIAVGTEPKWMHPGLAPRRFAPQAAQKIAQIAPGAVRTYLREILKGGGQ